MKIYSKDGKSSIESILYKYVSINTNLFSTLINSELWFSNPSDFNDPYDCNLGYNYSNISLEAIYNYLKNSKTEKSLIYKNALLQDIAWTLFSNPIECQKLGGSILSKLINDSGICCFSERDDTLLMWSHYSDSHKGVSLTFDVEKDINFFKSLFIVEYPDIYPLINPFNNYGKEIQLLLATKSKEWNYEKEIRVIKNNGINPQFRGLIKFDPKSLTEIKFGYKSSPEDIKTVSNLAQQKYPHIKLYQSKLKKAEFGIEFIPIN